MQDIELSREELIDRKLYQDITLLLFIYDPIRLCYNENIYEYETQSSIILNALKDFKDIPTLAEDIRSIFARLFSSDLADEFKDYELLAKQIERSFRVADIVKRSR